MRLFILQNQYIIAFDANVLAHVNDSTSIHPINYGRRRVVIFVVAVVLLWLDLLLSDVICML